MQVQTVTVFVAVFAGIFPLFW